MHTAPRGRRAWRCGGAAEDRYGTRTASSNRPGGAVEGRPASCRRYFLFFLPLLFFSAFTSPVSWNSLIWMPLPALSDLSIERR